MLTCYLIDTIKKQFGLAIEFDIDQQGQILKGRQGSMCCNLFTFYF